MNVVIAWFARNDVAANLLLAVIIGFGLWAVTTQIPMEVFPEFEQDSVIISVTYRGATPAEVEEAVIVRIEEEIATISGIDTIISTASEGSGQVQVDVLKGYKPREVMDDIRNKVDAITTFPEEVERPRYEILEFRREVISVIVGANLPEHDLRIIGEIVRDDLLALPEISLADLVAVRPYELSVEVDQATLEQYRLGLEDLAEAIRAHSLDLPAGAIKTRGGEILLRTLGQARTIEEFARIPLRTTPAGNLLLLGDIATIHDGFDEEPLEALLNGKPAVMIEVFRSGDQNALDVGRAVRDYVAEKSELLPPGVSIDYWRDRSRVVQLRLNTLTSSAVQGGILIFLTLALFLRFSVAIWVCAGIPVSFMGALALMPALGISLNTMSLFAFILVLGIVVDDAIITGENVYRRLKEEGESVEGIIAGTQEVAIPVTFGLLTTIAAFTPLLFMEGVRGPIFAQIPMIVIPALTFSWIESKLILPAHLRTLQVTRTPRGLLFALRKLQQKVANGLESFARNVYQPVLGHAIRRRHLTLSLFTAVIIIIVSFVASGRYGYTFFPRIQSEIARATLVMPAGTSIEQTRIHIEHMAREAYALQEIHQEPNGSGSVIRNILVSVGWSGTGRPGMGGSPETGQVTIEMLPPEERLNQISTTEIVNQWRQQIGTIPGVKELTYRAEIGRGGNPIEVQLTGADFGQLTEVAEILKLRYSEYPGLFDIKDSFDHGKQEIRLRLLPDARLLGLTTSDLGRQVRAAFFGSEAQRIQRGRDDVRVMVRYPKEQRQTLASLESMKIRTQSGVEVPFNQVAAIDMQAGYSTISRIDRNRAVNVSADAEKGEVDTNAIAADLQIYLDQLLREYPGIRYAFKGELEEQKESMGSLIYGVVFVIFAIYALLAIPFRSYLQPLPVMIVIPFSIGGAIIGHMIMGYDLSFMSLLGILALCGVVINNSLVLVDFINRRRRAGMPLLEAVMLSGVDRFRPILLTSLTTFLGLIPLLLETSTQAQFMIPMAISLGFGILFGAFLSLLLVPATYLILEEVIAFCRGVELS